ncbi:MAG: hypothetical protein DRI54_00165 [Bacteroidetes bacterium]|nr:MAG: hypothetical protein DRI54_00165 [Bacteroidota bacterium]
MLNILGSLILWNIQLKTLKMKSIIISALVFLFAFNANAQYKRVKLWANHDKIQELAKQGIAVDHGLVKKDTWFIGEFSVTELNIIQSLDVSYDVLVDDMETYYVEQNNNTKSLDEYPCDGGGGFEFDVPEAFELGSMGGYFTYEEFLMHIDSMAARYPELISAKQPISDFQTHEGRPIYWLRISDNPNVDEEDEPEVLYTALHHAREPAGLSQLIFYMYYLLENYDSDPDIKLLVDNTEMYFVPMINPDGYNYNQSTNPNGGGMWRKNRRDNDGNPNNMGVDLNRNYGYEWGGSGSSGDFSFETYRGPDPFSEPETQAIKYLCENHEFEFAFNYHTYGNLLLFPYGFDFNQFTPDHDYFLGFTEELVRYNNYANQISAELYPAAGDSDDWLYGGDTKPTILSMTPEVGSSFWPASSEILGLCRENLYMNLTLARLAGVYAQLTYRGSSNIQEVNGTIPFNLRRLGVEDGNIQISFEELSGNLELYGITEFEFTDPEKLEEMEILLEYSLILDIPDGSPINIVAHIDNGTYITDEYFDLFYGSFISIVSSDGESIEPFNTDNWNTTDEDSYSPDHSITDSPYGNYGDNSETWIELVETVDLSELDIAFLSFWTKWDIESSWDYAQVLASADGGNNWTPLCGEYNHAGNDNQDFEQPIYDGTNSEWVNELIPLDDYIGGEVKIAFRLVSDQSVVGDGFYFDDLEILSFSIVDGIDEVKNEIEWNVFPNPASQILHVRVSFEQNAELKYEIIDILGKVILDGTFFSSEDARISISDLNSGTYFIRLTTSTGQIDYHKFQKIK